MNNEAREAARVLRELDHVRRRADEVESRVRFFRDEARWTGGSFQNRNSHSQAASKIENYMAKMIDLEDQMTAVMTELAEKRAVIQNAIQAIEREDYKRMLELRFLDGLDWHQIQHRMNISSSTSYRMYEEALTAFNVAYENLGVHGS